MHNRNHWMNHSIQNIAEEVMNNSVSDLMGQPFAVKTPSANIKESDSHYIIEIVAPGLVKSDFNIAISNGKLDISVEKSPKDDAQNIKMTKTQWSYDQWKRSFSVGENIDSQSVTAKYDLGILVIHLAKKVKSQLAQTIKVDIK